MKTLVIQRDRWARGEWLGGSVLFRERDNKMCCLGFLGLGCGITETSMNEVGFPSTIRSHHWPDKLFVEAPNACLWEDVLARINDEEGCSEEEREAWIKAGFLELFDIDLTFEG